MIVVFLKIFYGVMVRCEGYTSEAQFMGDTDAYVETGEFPFTFVDCLNCDTIVEMLKGIISDAVERRCVMIVQDNLDKFVREVVAGWKEGRFDVEVGDMDSRKCGVRSEKRCLDKNSFESGQCNDDSTQTSELAKTSDVPLLVEELIDFCDEILGL
jgi:hypothetical protein